jgi:hypothetical protein
MIRSEDGLIVVAARPQFLDTIARFRRIEKLLGKI